MQKMSWVRIWVHMVFSTKNRIPYLKEKSVRHEMFKHIKENAYEKDIYLDCINGYSDHAHCIISLGREQTISKIAQLIKGESSYWINQTDLLQKPFRWQTDFWAVSVGESQLESVRKYIKNQEEHHRVKSFSEEIDEWVKNHGLKNIIGS